MQTHQFGLPVQTQCQTRSQFWIEDLVRWQSLSIERVLGFVTQI
jgi:hypothetical protein